MHGWFDMRKAPNTTDHTNKTKKIKWLSLKWTETLSRNLQLQTHDVKSLQVLTLILTTSFLGPIRELQWLGNHPPETWKRSCLSQNITGRLIIDGNFEERLEAGCRQHERGELLGNTLLSRPAHSSRLYFQAPHRVLTVTIPSWLWQKEGKSNLCEIHPMRSQSPLGRERLCRSLSPPAGRTFPPPSLPTSSKGWGEGSKKCVRVTAQGHGATSRLRFNHRL